MKQLFKRCSALLLALTMLLLSGCVQPNASTPGSTAHGPTQTPTTTAPKGPEDEYFLPKEEGCNQITFYWNYDGDAATSSFWIWPEGGNGYSYLVYECGFGLKCMVNIPKDVTRIGFIAIHGCSSVGGDTWPGGTKDYDGDRYLDITGDDMEVYLKSGDPNIYYSDDGGNTLTMDLKINIAGITAFNKIQYKLNAAKKISDLSQIKVFDGDRELTVSGLSTMNNTVNHGVITLAENLDLSKVYTLRIEGYGDSVVVPTGIFDSEEFITNYTYDGDDLGAVIQPDGSTTFKVWAPTASKVVLNLFTAGNDVDAYANLEMTKAEKGVWELNVAETGHGVYYTYTVTTSVGTQEAVDPYAKAAGLNGDRGMVVDLAATDPSNWNADQFITLNRYTDALIWEIHVRDFSNKLSGSNYPGKYLAFTERGLKNSSGISVGVDYLLNLGITHLHMLPVYDYASVDESNPTFNWGYDPENYNVPEGSYSTDPYHGDVRINEFKQMVQSLHNDGLGVIMDVVYNHTFDANPNFNKIVPYYYYRFNDNGTNTSASGCGNDTASERYMFRKFMVESVSYWAKEYHLDGFRFDLMGLHDLETMRQIEEAVHAINPNAIIYGEGWTMGSTIDGSAQANQTNISKIPTSSGAAGAVAVFNDAIRDGLKGSVFEATGKGYINGNYAPNASKVQFGIQGGFGFGIAWNVKNAAIINYMSAHDNNTLWDKLHLSNPTNTHEELLAMNRLGAAIVMISKGTPFWQAGEEMLRTKVNADGSFNENSYNASDAVNNINWECLTADSDEYAMMLYYKGLIELRQNYEIFRSNSDDVTITFETMTGGGMVVKYASANGQKALVLINPTNAGNTYTLEGSWSLVANGTQAGKDVLSTMTGEVSVDAGSLMIFVN
jgi:pullulanase